jgi:hypothetical protein
MAAFGESDDMGDDRDERASAGTVGALQNDPSSAYDVWHCVVVHESIEQMDE